MNAIEKLDQIIDQLDQTAGAAAPPATGAAPATGDAINRVLDAPPRTTAVKSLRDEPVMQQFRQELTDGLIRADTVRQFLAIIQQVLSAALSS